MASFAFGLGLLSEVSGEFCICTGLMSSWHWDGNEACKVFLGASLYDDLPLEAMGCVPTHPESNIQVDTNIQDLYCAPPFSQCPSLCVPHRPPPLSAYFSSSLLYFSLSPTPFPQCPAPRSHHIPTRPLPSDPPYHSAVTPTLASDSDIATSPPHHCKPAHADRSPVPAAPGPNTGPYRRCHIFRPSSSPLCAC